MIFQFLFLHIMKNIEIICNKLINLNFPLDILIIDDSSPDDIYEFAKEKFDNLKILQF